MMEKDYSKARSGEGAPKRKAALWGGRWSFGCGAVSKGIGRQPRRARRRNRMDAQSALSPLRRTLCTRV